jgi:dTDP-4-dehydrorhamnose 3,5-epimerase
MSIEFNIQESTEISGVYILKSSMSEDARGNIWTSFLKDEVEKLLPRDLYFKHDKFSTSKHNVLRGIHGDTKSWKLVTCVHGEIQQVVVDCRKDS